MNKRREQQRMKLYWWFSNKLFKIPEGQVAPMKLKIVRYILFPKDFIHLLFFKYYAGIEYNPFTNVYKIEGTEFSSGFLKMFSRDAKEGRIFRVTLNNYNEVVIEDIEAKSSLLSDLNK